MTDRIGGKDFKREKHLIVGQFNKRKKKEREREREREIMMIMMMLMMIIMKPKKF